MLSRLRAFISWKESALSASLGFVGFFLVAEGYSRLRGIEGLGMGDWKLAAMMGAFLGGQRLLLIVFLGSLSGMTFGLIQALKQRSKPHRAPAVSSDPQQPETVAVQTPSDGALKPESDAVLGRSQNDATDPPSIGQFRLPFGTFLAASAIFTLFFGDVVLAWYSSLFSF